MNLEPTLSAGPGIKSGQALPLHFELGCDARAQDTAVFEYVDRPEHLSSHMARRSWQLAGGSMTIATDVQGGRAVGSRIWLRSRMLGMDLHVECQVVRHEPSRLKIWETIGEPRLLVIGRYRMTVRIDAHGDRSHVLIAIDYALPSRAPARWVGVLLGAAYARWCVGQMVRDLRHQFATPH